MPLFSVIDTPKRIRATKESIYLPFVIAVKNLSPGKSIVITEAALKHEFTAKDPCGGIYSACRNAGLPVSIIHNKVDRLVFITRTDQK